MRCLPHPHFRLRIISCSFGSLWLERRVGAARPPKRVFIRPFAQGFSQWVGRRYSVLNSEVHTNAANQRHGVYGIPINNRPGFHHVFGGRSERSADARHPKSGSP